MINLINDDCIRAFPSIENKSVNCIICDLPYGVTKNKWDSVIPFDILWREYFRVAKDNAAIILFGQDKFSAKLMLSQEKIHRYNLIWKKGERTTGFLNAGKMPLRNHEDILVFYKKLPTYNPQFSEGIPLHSMGSRYLDSSAQLNNCYGKFIKGENEDKRSGSRQKYPKSVLNFERPHPPIHPTQKPVKLLEYLINTYSNPGDVILDNTMGVGTTGIACVNTSRSFIGIEIDNEYFAVAQKSIDSALSFRK